MKRNIFYLLVAFGLSACNDSFLEVYPKDEQTVATAFVSYSNFKTYAWGLYDILPGYNDLDLSADKNGGNLVAMTPGGEVAWAMSRVKVPGTGGGWDFGYIRRVNLMLDHIDQSKMTDVEKNHWKAVGLFFRSVKYLDLLSRFGDVVWVEHVLNETSPELSGVRDSRDVVADNIYRDLDFAAANIKENGDGVNTINRNVVNAFISRFGLFEGTWRKYHGLQGADKYLRFAADAALEVITKIPDVNLSYDDLFNSEDLTGVKGIILFRQYTASLNGHGYTRRVCTGEAACEATRDLVDSYLCTDGKPISTSPKYAGNTSEYDNFRNRDRRLYLTVCPPYKTNNLWNNNSTEPDYSDVPVDNEYIDIMNASANVSWTGSKRLPHTNFRGYINPGQPNLKSSSAGVKAWGSTNMGYFMWKYYNTVTNCDALTTNTTDAPIFRVGEVMLNYAEAKCELGEFDQNVANATINKLRSRAGVAGMSVSEVNDGWDTARDPDVDPLLWEIRRERRVELACEGFAFNDIRRWKKADKQLNKKPVGAWINRSDYGNSAKIKLQNAAGETVTGDNTSGFAWFYDTPTGWLSHYYLYPLPFEELTLNPNLVQNPVWGETTAE